MTGKKVSTRTIIADDHPVVLLGIKALLHEHNGNFQIVGEAGNGRQLLQLLKTCPCDLLITDYSMPDGNNAEDGLAWLKRLHRLYPQLPIIVLTMIHNPALVHGILAAGIKGVVGKAAMTRELLMAIAAVRAGRTFVSEHMREANTKSESEHRVDPSLLSPREAEVVRLYASGQTVTEIAERLHRSVKTISQQKNDAMRKLGLSSNSQLYEYAHQQGLAT